MILNGMSFMCVLHILEASARVLVMKIFSDVMFLFCFLIIDKPD